ncbi:MAG: hypothetical protein NDI82_01850, partial [Anaeromyxobacteraceae bacterium]|nr:hypothetical protein [Anaeromyxobacteraceae bacterium]
MTRLHRRLALAAALAALALPAAHAAAPVPQASFEDAPGDADGDLDLRRFAVLRDGADLLLVVTLGAQLPPGGLSRQALHLYLDTDATPGAGSSAALPGPKVAFAGGRTWEAAVLLSPRPDEARGEVRRAPGAAADRVVVPAALTVRGRALTA